MKHLFTILIALVALSSFAQKALPAEVIKSIESRIANGYSPSIAIGIIDKDGPQYYLFGSKTAGGQPVNEHTIYEIGSISKTFTGILLAQAVLEEKVKTDDPAQKHLPSTVKLPTKDDKQITLGHLSDHTSALARMPTNFNPKDPANPYADYTVDQMYAFLNGYTLPREIGSKYEYSNLAQGLLGHILALKAGTSYEALMLSKIANPLGMKETKITFDEKMKQNLAMGYSQGVQVSNWDIPTLAGAGAIRSSVHDMLIYLQANMGLKKSKLLPAMQLSQQARHDKVGGGTRVGLGWHISKGAEGDVIWHNGGTGGYRTFVGFVKETGKGVVVLTNSSKGADDLGMHLLNSTAKLIEVKKAALIDIKKAADAQGGDAAWKVYEELKKDQVNKYEFNEDEINTLGYTYLQGGNTKAALALFKINVTEYPKSANAYDSYGEALMNDGQKEAAIENYKKSLELNPGNTNATDMLAKMGVGEGVKIFPVEESVLESYVGVYELAPNFTITITRIGNKLFGQATGQGQFELFPKSETEFFLKVVEARVTFSVKEGKVESMTLFQGGQVLPGKRIK
ncbi:serine hydrolase [Haliscomenobacter sp.]|uniref:serine hydrolase n=1 Tax=Haliscomenobacter sp. TaxID=2717303 RepID=UPI003BA9E48D